jgi:hypothetical protein
MSSVYRDTGGLRPSAFCRLRFERLARRRTNCGLHGFSFFVFVASCLANKFTLPGKRYAVYPVNLCPIQFSGAAIHSRPRRTILHNETADGKR